MSLTKPLLLFVFLVSSLASATAVETSCPERLRDGRKIGNLVDARVFNGAPADLVELMPNLETSEWDVSINQAYAEEHGESMYLVCHYKGIKKTVQLRIPYADTLCVIKGVRGGGTYAGCKPSKPQVGQSMRQE